MSDTISGRGTGSEKAFGTRATGTSGQGSRDAVVAYALLRLSFGANIMLHGVSRLLTGHQGFLNYVTHYFEKVPGFPTSTLPAFAYLLPPVEGILGLLLAVGLATRFSLIAGSLVMTALVVGTNLAADWTVAGLQLIYCFIYYFLLARRDLNVISVDGMMQGDGAGGSV